MMAGRRPKHLPDSPLMTAAINCGPFNVVHCFCASTCQARSHRVAEDHRVL